MPPIDASALRAACEGRLDAEVLHAETTVDVELGGEHRLHAETGSSGTGMRSLWMSTSWLIDPFACTAVGLDIHGARGVSERWTSFRGAGSTAELDWLLQKAGYQPYDASNPEHALTGLIVNPPVPGEPRQRMVGALRVSVTTAPPLDWRAGAPPERFLPVWLPVEGSPEPPGAACPCYRIPHPVPLLDHVKSQGSRRLHAYYGVPILLSREADSASVVEEPARHRWAFYAGDRRGGAPVGTSPYGVDPDAPAPALTPPPAALRAWTWTQQGVPEDEGVGSVLAQGSDPWTWTRLDLQFQDEQGRWSWPQQVAWVEGGLSVIPADGDPILVPTATLLELLKP